MPDSDSIISAVMLRELLKRHEIAVEIKFGTRPDGVTERTVSELGILDGIDFDGFEPDDKLVLVDHHVTFYKNETVACVDHHTTPPEPDFEFNLVLSASSCGKIVFDMARSVDAADGWLEKLAIYSVYLDTQSCLAPKFDKNDIPWIKEGIKRLDLDENDLVKKGFCLNSIDERSDVLAMYAYKRYEFGGKVGASTCIQIDDTQQDWQEKITEIIEFLKMKREGDGIALWALVVNKPVLVRSDLYFIREDGVEKVILDRLASRSRDVVPHMKNI
jgi:inorganic pyrophosphatase/exopolyphosphatase